MIADGPRVAVVGSGAWGTTLAILVARREHSLLIAHSVEAGEDRKSVV